MYRKEHVHVHISYTIIVVVSYRRQPDNNNKMYFRIYAFTLFIYCFDRSDEYVGRLPDSASTSFLGMIHSFIRLFAMMVQGTNFKYLLWFTMYVYLAICDFS